MTEPTTEPMTDAEWLIVMMLCQFDNQFVGPNAWMCRLAWFTYQSGQPFDVDAAIAQHADWMNRPENADTRTNLVGCIDYIRKAAAKPHRWQIPENAFDPKQWMTDEDASSLRVELWHGTAEHPAPAPGDNTPAAHST